MQRRQALSHVCKLGGSGMKKIAVFDQDDAYGKTRLEGVTRAMSTLGLQPASLGTVDRNTIEVAQAVKDIMAQKPEAIVQIGACKAVTTFVRQARRAGRALTREGFINAVQGMQSVNPGGFPVDFSPGKHMGSRFVELTLLTEDGRIRRRACCGACVALLHHRSSAKWGCSSEKRRSRRRREPFGCIGLDENLRIGISRTHDPCVIDWK